jgi:chlorophyll synthase
MTELNPSQLEPESTPIAASEAEQIASEAAPAANLDERNAKTRQLLGMKGAQVETSSIWKIRLQLMKPITWIPLIWGVVCGAASSGNFTWSLENVLISAACMLLSGPLLAGYTQTLNDFYDRDIDAINEPYRPIPSGAISIPQVATQILVLLFAGIALAYGLDRWAGHEFPTITVLALFGSFLSYIYSAPPLKLKKNGWLGNYALGASYIALPWWAGHALFGDLNLTIVILTLFYSLAGLGIAVVNDFKSVEGDRQLGLQSLPVMFGITTAAWICVLMIDVFQAGIAAYLIHIQENLYAAILLLMVIPQITFQDMYFLRDPLKNDVKYQASAQPFLVLGMLVTALALGHAGV